MDRLRVTQLAEAYGDNPLEILRNGMLGAARKKKLQKFKDLEQKKAQVTQLVMQWETALASNKPALIAWLVGKLR